MSAICQFWLNFSAQAFAAIATFVAALVALFGPRWQRQLFPPTLSIKLLNTKGERTEVTLGAPPLPDGTVPTRQAFCRYYHLVVTNSSKLRWPPATGVELHLQLIQTLGADDAFHTIWSGSVPMRRKFQEHLPLTATVGPPAEYDLCNVVKDKWLELCPLIVPNNMTARWRQKTRVRAQFQARSVEVDSNPVFVEIAWSGSWSDDADEMTRHLVVKEIER